MAVLTSISGTWTKWLYHDEGVAVNYSMTPVQLGQYLARFYADIKAKDGRPFTKNALRGMRAGLQRAFRAPPYSMNNINLTMDPQFQTANEVFEKRCNYFSSLENHPPILKEDLVKLECYLNPYESPVKLLHTVWFLLCYYFDQQGRDRLRESSKQSFRIALDDSGQLFLAMIKEGHVDQTGVPAAKIAYGIHPKDDTKSLPSIFRFYLSKLNPGCDALFQRPRQFRTTREMEESAVWFERIPVGAKAIGYLMTLISEKANLSKLYTIYSVRATSHNIAAISRFPRYSKMHPHPLNISLSHS
ncbi:hypothetical protein ACJMK2_012662 [Sinanodonta woodiana]|uniref:DUF3504 domain-containing protein n=1 Tax=Sinanodonta woodiana TaxID=1069815 RepID=A0ABD3VAK4_SINWO